MVRPDLSFLTKQQFNSFEELTQFCEQATDEQALIISIALSKIPELLQVAEMHHDQNMNKPDSINFKIVSGLLNEIQDAVQS